MTAPSSSPSAWCSLPSPSSTCATGSQSFTRSRWRQFVRIVLPALLPFMFATMRISFGVAWKVALAAELFGGRSGLGYLFNIARQNFDMPLILVIVIVIIAFVYGTDRLVF